MPNRLRGTRVTPSLPDVPAAVLRCLVLDQSVDGPVGARRPGPSDAAVGTARRDVRASRPRRRDHRVGPWSTGHGVQRQQRRRRRRQGARPRASAIRNVRPSNARTGGGSHGRGFREVRAARAICEGEGDVTFVGSVALAGWGFRTTRSAHDEHQEFFGRPVVSLRLCDPCFYHLDMALCVLDNPYGRVLSTGVLVGKSTVLERLFPDAIRVRPPDAYALGLNAVSDGRHVVLPRVAAGMADLVTRPRVRARPGRDVGVRQGRRRREVLHAGAAMTADLLTLRERTGHTPVERHSAQNYDPLPVTLARGRGAWVEDDHGQRYLDFLSAYSALNFGHCHPRLVATACRAVRRIRR